MKRITRIRREGMGWGDTLVWCSGFIFAAATVDSISIDFAHSLPGIAVALGLSVPWALFFYWFYARLGRGLLRVARRMHLPRLGVWNWVAKSPVRTLLIRRTRLTYADIPRHLVLVVAPMLIFGMLPRLTHGDPLLWIAYVGGAYLVLFIAGIFAAIRLGDRFTVMVFGQEGAERFHDRMIDALRNRGYDTSELQARRDNLRARNTHRLPSRAGPRT